MVLPVIRRHRTQIGYAVLIWQRATWASNQFSYHETYHVVILFGRSIDVDENFSKSVTISKFRLSRSQANRTEQRTDSFYNNQPDYKPPAKSQPWTLKSHRLAHRVPQSKRKIYKMQPMQDRQLHRRNPSSRQYGSLQSSSLEHARVRYRRDHSR